MPSQSKDYCFNGLAGCVVQSVSRDTGTLVGVYYAEQAGMDSEGTPWYTVCEVHHNCIGHSTLRLAKSWASYPSEWCEDCISSKKDVNV